MEMLKIIFLNDILKIYEIERDRFMEKTRITLRDIVTFILGLLFVLSMLILAVYLSGTEDSTQNNTDTGGSNYLFTYNYYNGSDGKIAISGVNDTSLTEIEIPSEIDGKTVIGISKDAFRECKSLKSVTIPDSVVEIKGHAFQNCTELESIELPVSINFIGEYAFNNCTALESINIPRGVQYIQNNAFDG